MQWLLYIQQSRGQEEAIRPKKRGIKRRYMLQWSITYDCCMLTHVCLPCGPCLSYHRVHLSMSSYHPSSHTVALSLPGGSPSPPANVHGDSGRPLVAVVMNCSSNLVPCIHFASNRSPHSHRFIFFSVGWRVISMSSRLQVCVPCHPPCITTSRAFSSPPTVRQIVSRLVRGDVTVGTGQLKRFPTMYEINKKSC